MSQSSQPTAGVLPNSNNAAAATAAPLPPLVAPQKLQEIFLTTTGHVERLEGPVEQALNRIAEEFLDEIVGMAADLATHRNSAVIETQDILLPLEQAYGLVIPGFVDSESKAKVTDSHRRQRMLGSEAHQARRQQVSRVNK